MVKIRSKIARNQTALASLGAGILLCTLAAFVYITTGDIGSDPHGSRVSAPLNVDTTNDRAGLRESLTFTASYRVRTIDSWRVVLQWAASAEATSPGAASVNVGQAEHVSSAESGPPGWSGRGEASTRLPMPVKSDADAVERIADEKPNLTGESGTDSEE